MIFLVGRGGQRIYAARDGQGLILGSERRRGHLRDHEAGVNAALADQKRRQPREIRVHQERGAPLGQRADLGDRERQAIRRERDRLAVEISASEHLARFRKHQRIVRYGIGLGEQHIRGAAHLVEAGAHDLWLAAQGVRVLDARTVAVRVADRAAGEELTQYARCIRLPAMSAERLDALVEGRVAAETGIHGERTGDQRGSEHALACEQAGKRERGRDLCAIEEGEPFLRRQTERHDASMRQRLSGRHRPAVDARLALADQDAREMRERRQIA
jgi:hypothetical protein